MAESGDLQAFKAGFRDCQAEAISFLMKQENVPEDDPIIVGLKQYLSERQVDILENESDQFEGHTDSSPLQFGSGIGSKTAGQLADSKATSLFPFPSAKATISKMSEDSGLMDVEESDCERTFDEGYNSILHASTVSSPGFTINTPVSTLVSSVSTTPSVSMHNPSFPAVSMHNMHNLTSIPKTIAESHLLVTSTPNMPQCQRQLSFLPSALQTQTLPPMVSLCSKVITSPSVCSHDMHTTSFTNLTSASIPATISKPENPQTKQTNPLSELNPTLDLSALAQKNPDILTAAQELMELLAEDYDEDDSCFLDESIDVSDYVSETDLSSVANTTASDMDMPSLERPEAKSNSPLLEVVDSNTSEPGDPLRQSTPSPLADVEYGTACSNVQTVVTSKNEKMEKDTLKDVNALHDKENIGPPSQPEN